MIERVRAPWNDFAGKPVHTGDTIRHPDGSTGVVRYEWNRHEALRWRVDYDDGVTGLALFLQINSNGQAVVIESSE